VTYAALLAECSAAFTERARNEIPEDWDIDDVVSIAQDVCNSQMPSDLAECFAIILSDSEFADMQVAFGDSETVRDSATMTLLALMHVVISQAVCADIMLDWFLAHPL
jgi:hypothetical protein